MSRFNVRGKVILISGSTDGLGLTMAQGLAKEGWLLLHPKADAMIWPLMTRILSKA